MSANKRVPVHMKIHTGMSRFGVRWDEALPLIEQIGAEKSLTLEGMMTHFAQSDETDKTFANLQFSRFNEVLQGLAARGISVKLRHTCNSGGFLDLPHAHLDMVRVGILLYGVFPSSVCRRIPGIEPVMSVKARIAAIQKLKPGEVVGYGMRYTAPSERRIAVLPIGYGDGFPRVRNQGGVLIHGQRAPLVGGIAMDALMVDITDIPQAQMWDEAVIMGRQGSEEITVHDMAKLKKLGELRSAHQLAAALAEKKCKRKTWIGIRQSRSHLCPGFLSSGPSFGDYKRLPVVKTRVWTSRKLCRNSSLSATAFSTSCLSKNISELLMTAWTLCLKASMG